MIDKAENVDIELENIINLLKEAKASICSEARMKELLGINLY